MPNPDDDQGAQEVNPAYLALYTKHLDEFRAHLAGRDGSEPPPASYFPPNACWSVAEKDAFFRGLAIYSRLRPDLIAAEVKTKTVPDVCVYLALLEQATRDASRATVYIGAENNSVDPRVPRRELPAAVEVSERWLQLEERMAGALVSSEAALQREATAKERAKEVHARQRTLRARKGQARTASNERDREGERQRRKEFDVWHEEAQAKWAAEDAWNSLDHASLAALDRMLREDEEGCAFGDLADDAEGLAEHQEAHSAPLGGPPHSPHDTPAPVPGEEFIDPILLEMSRPATAMSTISSAEPPPLASADPGTPKISLAVAPQPSSTAFQPSTPPFPPLAQSTDPVPALLPPALITASAPTVAEDDSVSDAAEGDLASMSPASRRRFQKRLYMRRKRAQASGKTADQNTTRLKPGRKPKQRPPGKNGATPAESTLASSPMIVDDTPLPEQPEEPSGEAETAQYRHPKISGKTLPYKRQTQFASIGIDAQRLYHEGLGLFHFQSISRLMQTYNQLHDVPDEVASHIAVETFQLLHAIVAQFVAEVMSRAITSREQERIAKLQTKAWRLRENQNISAIHVKHALALFGADCLDKRSHFEGLLKKLGLDEAQGDRHVVEELEDDDDDDDDDDESVAQDDDADQEASSGDAETTETPLEPLPLIRMLFPPFFNPNAPASSSGTRIDEHSDSLDPSVYMPWPSSSLLSTSSEPPREEDLLPQEIDQVTLAAELLEDEEIDKEDVLRDMLEESALLARVGRNTAGTAPRPGQANEDTELKTESVADQVPRPRKRKGRPRGRSKSVRLAEEQAESGGEGAGGSDGEEGGDGMQRRVRPRKAKSKGKGTAHLNEDQLRFMEPDPNGRIKSSVYVLDSD